MSQKQRSAYAKNTKLPYLYNLYFYNYENILFYKKKNFPRAVYEHSVRSALFRTVIFEFFIHPLTNIKFLCRSAAQHSHTSVVHYCSTIPRNRTNTVYGMDGNF